MNSLLKGLGFHKMSESQKADLTVMRKKHISGIYASTNFMKSASSENYPKYTDHKCKVRGHLTPEVSTTSIHTLSVTISLFPDLIV